VKGACHGTCRWLITACGLWLVLLAAGSAGTAEAPTLTVYVEGVSGALRRNVVLLLLDSTRQAGEPVGQPSAVDSLKKGLKPLTGNLGVLDALKVLEGEGGDPKQPIGVYRLTVDENRLRWLHGQAEDNIRLALQPFGYYQPQVTASLEQTGQNWVARYRIEPGPPVRITRLELQVNGAGRRDPAFQALLAQPPLTRGAILNDVTYEDFKRRLQTLAAERGYFDAKLVQHQIRVDIPQHSAEVFLHLDSGDRYRLGSVRFSGAPLDESLLRRYVKFQPGDPYDADLLLQLQSELSNSDYFSQAEVEAPPARAVGGQIPVAVRLQPRDARRYSIGLGYGTDTGVRGKLGFTQFWVNRWGHRVETEALASQIRWGLRGEYIIPGRDPASDAYTLYAALDREKSDVLDTFAAYLGGSWRTRYGLWRQTIAISYGIERFRFDEEQTSRLLMPSVQWGRVAPPDVLNVTAGTRFELTLRGAYQPLLSDVSFAQAMVNGKWITPLGERGRLLLRGQLGTSLIDDFAALPPSVRFFAGGDTSVRGYAYDKIGPRDDAGNVIGGKHLIVGSVEYEYRLYDQWGIATFVDSGDAFDSARPALKVGAGLGFRWYTPFGPLRLDVAHGFEDPGDPVRLHLTFGPEL
jgi:translocation and assembly module TamA